MGQWYSGHPRPLPYTVQTWPVRRLHCRLRMAERYKTLQRKAIRGKAQEGRTGILKASNVHCADKSIQFGGPNHWNGTMAHKGLAAKKKQSLQRKKVNVANKRHAANKKVIAANKKVIAANKKVNAANKKVNAANKRTDNACALCSRDWVEFCSSSEPRSNSDYTQARYSM